MNTSGKKKLLTIQYFVFGRGIVFILFQESQKGKHTKKNDYSGTNGFLKLISEGILSGL